MSLLAICFDYTTCGVFAIPDLRTVEGKRPQRPSAELLDVLKIMLMRQEWYRDYLQQQLAHPLTIAGRFNATSSTESIVADMRHRLNMAVNPVRGVGKTITTIW